MKLVHKSLSKDGKVGLIPEDSDDLWHVYNLVQRGDLVQTTTFRKVISESATGSTAAQKVKTTVTVSAEKIQFDAEADIVKVKGKNVEENRHIKMGQYHTLSLELSKRFFLIKPDWDSLAKSQLNRACDSTRNAEVAVVMMQEGLAYLCLLTTNMCVQKAKIEINIPRKRRNFCSQHEKGLEDFYEQIFQAILRHVAFDSIKCVIVASPGFLKDHLYDYIWAEATKRDLKSLLNNRQKFLTTHSSTGFKHSIKEILSNKDVQARLEDTKAVAEVRLWDKFLSLLNTCPNKAIYGVKEVEVACKSHAIHHLLLTDSMFRSSDLTLRKKISNLIYKVNSYGGDVRILSSMHQTGEQLNGLTGIAAILKFEVPELQVLHADGVECDSSSDSSWSTSSCSTASSKSSTTY